MPNVEISWGQIEQFTQAMREASVREEWETVLELANTRHHEVLAHFEKFPVGPDNAAFYQTRLMTMLNGEKDLQLIATNARREVMRESLVSNRNHRAVGAYLS
jgi:hypothetical protein